MSEKKSVTVPGLVFVLPERSEKTHFRYVAEFACSLAEDIDLFLVIEKKSEGEGGGFSGKSYMQQFSMPALRFMEHFFVLLYLRTKGYKKFYIHYSFVSAISAGIISKLSGGTVYYWNAGMPWKYSRSKMRELMERLAYKLIDYLVTGAQALVPGYSAYYNLPINRIHVIPNWIEPSPRPTPELIEQVRKDIAAPEGATVLLFVHRLAKRKGAHYLPNILSALKKENLILAVVGDGPEREAIEKQFFECGLTDKVRMLGEKSREYVEAIFTCADLFILPSEEEGSPHSLLEAMMAGVPFVAFNVGGVYEHTPPQCINYVIDTDAVGAFVGGIKKLLHNKEEYARFKEAEAAYVTRFSKSNILRQFKNKIL